MMKTAKEEEEFDEEEEEDPDKKIPKFPTKTKAREPRFHAYHVAEKIGIYDKQEDKTIGEDLMSILANMKNDLQEIKEAVLG